MPELSFHLRGEYGSRRVWLNGREIFPRRSQEIRNHSPDGFAWGYGGSGPAQLALAILLELFPQDVAEAHYQDFKFQVIAALPQTSFHCDLAFSTDEEKA